MPRQTDDQLEGSGGLFDLLLGNKDTREEALRLLKKAKPDMNIPEIDLADKVNATITARSVEDKNTITALESKVLQMEVSKRLDDQRASVVAKGIVTADEIPAVEKLITDMGFPNYETAARYYFAQKQLAPPTPASYHERAFQSLPENFIKDPSGAADKLAHEMVDQMNPNHILRH